MTSGSDSAPAGSPDRPETATAGVRFAYPLRAFFHLPPPWPHTRAETGLFGELKAARLLRKKRYRILTRNYRSFRDARDEIDIVALDKEALVFVEVRARRAEALVQGYDSLTERKREALLRACRAYLEEIRTLPDTFRFDVVEVAIGARPSVRLLHHENVKLFPKSFLPKRRGR